MNFKSNIQEVSRLGAFLPLLLTAVLGPSCGGGGSGASSSGPPLPITPWIWVAGPSVTNKKGTYGTKGVPSLANLPGGRLGASSWTDAGGNFWLFGGQGLDASGVEGFLNDLWKFDGSAWTWMSGSSVVGQWGVYGTKGVTDAGNTPGARYSAGSWIDPLGNLWLFGGTGTDSVGAVAYLNDLWKYDGSGWTWVSGSNIVMQTDTYGTLGVPDAANVPGARTAVCTWVDLLGNPWLFGGFTTTGGGGYRNDLWKFDGTSWTWMSGSATLNDGGSYGTLGLPAASNVPSARERAISWRDAAGNLWLFGGDRSNGMGTSGSLNDLWKYDGTSWTWMSGANSLDQAGVYGVPGTAAPTNVPGARNSAVSWIDATGNLWLFGGQGVEASGVQGSLNDLWKYDGAAWTWMSGAATADPAGIYAGQGAPAPGNMPGPRLMGVSFQDLAGRFWILGGWGLGSGKTSGYLSDLWYYIP